MEKWDWTRKRNGKRETWKRVASLSGSLEGKAGTNGSPSSLVSPVVWLRRVQCCKTANNPLTKWHLYAITNNWWLVEAQSLVNLIRMKSAIGDVSRGLPLVLLALLMTARRATHVDLNTEVIYGNVRANFLWFLWTKRSTFWTKQTEERYNCSVRFLNVIN